MNFTCQTFKFLLGTEISVILEFWHFKKPSYWLHFYGTVKISIAFGQSFSWGLAEPELNFWPFSAQSKVCLNTTWLLANHIFKLPSFKISGSFALINHTRVLRLVDFSGQVVMYPCTPLSNTLKQSKIFCPRSTIVCLFKMSTKIFQNLTWDIFRRYEPQFCIFQLNMDQERIFWGFSKQWSYLRLCSNFVQRSILGYKYFFGGFQALNQKISKFDMGCFFEHTDCIL